MGAKQTCESKTCFNEPKFICLCFYIKMCPQCINRHKLANRNLFHKIIDIKEFKPLNVDPGQPLLKIRSMDDLILDRNLYQSPEGSTEV